MSQDKRKQRDPVATHLDEIARLLAVLIAKDRPLQDTIGELSGAGLGPTRIAELLGTTRGYATIAAARVRRKRSRTKTKSSR